MTLILSSLSFPLPLHSVLTFFVCFSGHSNERFWRGMFVFTRATGHFPSKIIVPLRSFLIIYLQQITNYIYFLTVLLQNSKKKTKTNKQTKKQNRTRKKARKLKRLIHPFHIKISTDQCIDQLYNAHPLQKKTFFGKLGLSRRRLAHNL